MSHYWTLEGEIRLDRKPTEEEFQAIADYFDCDVSEIKTGIGFNSSESIVFSGNTILLDGNENHFPSILCEILKLIDCHNEGEGIYHAEDRMSGEWSIENSVFTNEEYSDIVAELRSQLDQEDISE